MFLWIFHKNMLYAYEIVLSSDIRPVLYIKNRNQFMQKMNRFLYLSAFMRNIQAHPAASRQARWKPDKAPVPFPCTLLQTPHAPLR